MSQPYIRKSVVPELYDINLGFGQIFGVSLATLVHLKHDIEAELMDLTFDVNGQPIKENHE